MFFKKLVKQHRVHLSVAHRVWLAIAVENHQARIHFRDFFGHQSKLPDSRGVELLLITEGDGFKRKKHFARFIHRFDVLFEPRGGDEWAEPASRIDPNIRTGGGRTNEDTTDKAACVSDSSRRERTDRNHIVLASVTRVGDIDIVTAEVLVDTGGNAQGGVEVAGRVAKERPITVGRVVAAFRVVGERLKTGGRVAVTGCVVKEGFKTLSRVGATFCVAIERFITGGRVGDAGGAAIKRTKTSGRVLLAYGVEIERSITVNSVVVAVRVVRQRISASADIKKPAGVAKERINASGCVEAAIGIARQGSKTRRRILIAGSEVVKRLETGAGVPDPSGAADEHTNTFAIVGARYVTVRVGPTACAISASPKQASRNGTKRSSLVHLRLIDWFI